MILVDANLLIYAVDADSPRHDAARAWLEAKLGGPERVGLPWPALLAFLRLITNPRVFPRALRVDDAWRWVDEWLALPAVWIPSPSERHAEILGRLLRDSQAGANLVPDAHLAALAIEHGLLLCSTDADFGRFPAVRWENPIGS